MSVTIGNARISEFGTVNGKRGDQTGKEAQLKAWYNRPWTVVLRFPAQAVALTIAVLSHMYSAAPEKFGPSESAYRLVMGAIVTLIGAIIILYGLEVELYVVIAILIIGIAAIGLCATFIGNKTSKY